MPRQQRLVGLLERYLAQGRAAGKEAQDAQSRLVEGFRGVWAAGVDETVENNVATFLESSRVYNELYQKYWPTTEMSQAERVERTARRVGLTSAAAAGGPAGGDGTVG